MLWCIEVCHAWAFGIMSDMRDVGHDAETGRQIAIKKIKVGQFKDGLDMSAIREVKYLRELRHQNVITVSMYFM